MVPVERLARWAAASIPRASPDTVTNPASPRSRAMRSANFTPAAEALRDPTMAINGCFSTFNLPRSATTGGGVVNHLQARWIVRLTEHEILDADRALSSRSASSREQMYGGRGDPPRRARP